MPIDIDAGPGGVPASYGRRDTTGSKYDLTKKYGDVVSIKEDPEPSVAVTAAFDSVSSTTQLTSGSQEILARSSILPTNGGSNAKLSVLFGDSKTEAQLVMFPQDEAQGGWYSGNLTLDTPSGSPYIKAACCSPECGATDTVALTFDRTTGTMKVNIAGEGYGPEVNTTGLGYVTLVSGGGSKKLFLQVRSANTPSSASPWNLVNSGGKILSRIGFSGMWYAGLFAAGLGSNVKNYGMGGDRSIDMLNRLPQIVALAPRRVFFEAPVNDLINDVTSATSTSHVFEILDTLTAAGIEVICSTCLPTGTFTASQALNWVDYNGRLVDRCKNNYNGLVTLIDLSQALAVPTATFGAPLVTAADYDTGLIHQSIIATFGKTGPIISDVLRRKYPGEGVNRTTNLLDVYNASTNVGGNLFGVRGGMAGTVNIATSGGATPVPTGTVPTSWTCTVASGAFTTVTATSPEDAAAVARTDARGIGRKWWEVIMTNASGGAASRYLTTAIPNVPTPGQSYIFSLDLQLKDVLNLTLFDVFINFGGVTATMKLWELGTAPVATGAITLSEVMYLETGPITIPAGATSCTFWIQPRCGTGGSVTVRVDKPNCRLANPYS